MILANPSRGRGDYIYNARRYVRFSEDAFWDKKFGGNVGSQNEKDFSWNE